LIFLDLDQFIFGVHNFLISNLFSMIVSVLDAVKGEVQVLFAHYKQQRPSLRSSLPQTLEFSINDQSNLPIPTIPHQNYGITNGVLH
jgi:hypothetical protein